MGCSSSGAMNVARVRNLQRSVIFSAEFDEEEDNAPKVVVLTKEEQNQKDVQSILDGIASIPVPTNIMPVVSTSDDSFPIELVEFLVDPVQQSTISLPTLVVSNTPKGKYVVIGSSEILQHKMLVKTEISALIENVGMWGTNFRLKTVKVLLYGFSQHFMTSVASDLNAFGYSVEQAQELPEKLLFDFIFIPSFISSPDVLERLEDYATKGCLIIFATPQIDPETTYGVNDLIQKVGISIPKSNLVPAYNVAQALPYDKLLTKTIDALCKDFYEILSAETVDIDAIDAAVATLRFYVSSLGENQGELAAQITEKCWDFLEKTGYIDDGFYCSNIAQSVIAVLISDVMPQIPAELVKAAPPSYLFPGKCGDFSLDGMKMRMKISKRVMYSTGLYLPPGVIGTIEASGPILIQIGCHDECLIAKTGKWKRWPVITTTYEVKSGVKKVASPFGGIVYIGCRENKAVGVIFRNFSKYPRYSIDEQSWFNTKDIDVPWSEVEMHGITITIPTVIMHQFDDRIQENFEFLKKIIDDGHRFISLKVTGNKRVVFDADLNTDSPEVGDMIILTIEELPYAIDTSEFSNHLLKLISLIIMSSIPEDVLDEDATMAIATVASFQSLSINMPEKIPKDLGNSLAPDLFAQMWEIASSNPENFTKATASFFSQKFSEDTPAVEKWNTFVNLLKLQASDKEKNSLKRNGSLMKLNDRFKMTGLLSSNSSDFLQRFVLEDVSSDVIEKEKIF